MALIAVAVGHAFSWFPARSWSTRLTGTILPFGVLGFSYIVVYLGLGLLLVRVLRKFTHVGLVLSVLMQVLLLLLGSGVPLIIHLMSPELRNLDYSLVHVTDPIWSLAYLLDSSFGRGGIPFALSPDIYVLLLVIPLAALIVLLLNLPGVAREVRHLRIAKPKRVAEEDAQVLAVKRPPRPVKTSPWD